MNHDHDFDALSGWCKHCNLRDDGRMLTFEGSVKHAGPGYSRTELHDWHERVESVLDSRGLPKPGQRTDWTA